MQLQNPITPQIEQTIDYRTNRLARSFRLQPADKDDIRQELTLKALEAMRRHTSDMKANIETYTKRAICRRTIDLARAIIVSPSLTGIDTGCEIVAANTNADLAMDVQLMIKALPARQQRVCNLLMAGYTQKKIGEKLQVTQQRIGQIIDQVRLFLGNAQITPC